MNKKSRADFGSASVLDMGPYDWRFRDMEVWPLIDYSLRSLSIQIRSKRKRSGLEVGSPLWQAANVARSLKKSSHDLFSRIRQVQDPAASMIQTIETSNKTGASWSENTMIYANELLLKSLDSFTYSPLLDPLIHDIGATDDEPIVLWENVQADSQRLQNRILGQNIGLAPLKPLYARQGPSLEVLRLMRSAWSEFEHYERVVSKYLGLYRPFLRLWLAQQIATAWASDLAFNKLFDHFGWPKQAIIVNAGFSSTAGLCFALWKKNIPCYELQHGADNVLIRHQTVFSSASLSYNTLPTKLLSWQTDEEKQRPTAKAKSIFSDLLQAPNFIVPYGPPALRFSAMLSNLQSRPTSNTQPIQGSFKEFLTSVHQHKKQMDHLTQPYQFEVLFSLQPGMSYEWVKQWAERIQVVFKHQKTPGSQATTFFWIRHHPATWPHSAQSFLENQPNYIADSDHKSATSLPLDLLLERCCLHVTQFSAVTYEAAALNIPTLLLDDKAEEFFINEVPAHLLKKPSTWSAGFSNQRIPSQAAQIDVKRH